MRNSPLSERGFLTTCLTNALVAAKETERILGVCCPVPDDVSLSGQIANCLELAEQTRAAIERLIEEMK